jgi:O-antigen/teichoic acid export membrane protein
VTEALPVGTGRGLRAPGTTTMVAGGLIGGVLALVFQAVGGRVLGEEAFAPIAAIWTAFFIVASILLVPLEQYVTRETSRGRSLAEDRKVAGWVGALAVLAGAAYVYLSLDSEIFGGDSTYVVVMALLVAGYTVLFSAKGVLAGNRRFAEVGWILILEGVFRLVAGVAILAVVMEAPALAWAMVVAPLSVVFVRFWRHDRSVGDVEPVGARRFLGAYIVGSSASQLLLAGAPLGVDFLGGSPAMFTIIFWTFTLYRAPLTLIYSLQSRILPYLVSMGEDGNDHGLRRMSLGVLGLGAVLTVAGAAAGWWIGPEVVSLIFGESGTPARSVAMLAAGGVMAASTAQVGGQVLVARARTAALAAAWCLGLLVAVGVMALAGGDPDFRVAVGFAAGELAALLAVGLLITRSRPSRS